MTKTYLNIAEVLVSNWYHLLAPRPKHNPSQRPTISEKAKMLLSVDKDGNSPIMRPDNDEVVLAIVDCAKRLEEKTKGSFKLNELLMITSNDGRLAIHFNSKTPAPELPHGVALSNALNKAFNLSQLIVDR